MKQEIKSIYIPISNSSNKYVELVQESMKRNNISICGIKQLKSLRQWFATDVVNLNWFESRVNKKSLFQSVVAYLVNSTLLCMFKLCHMKIVVTIHNGNTHDAFHPELARKFYKKTCNMADAFVIMSEYSKNVLEEIGVKNVQEKSHLISHPTYSNAYAQSDKKLDMDQNKFQVAFLGQVRPYKNIEVILQAAEAFKTADICFHICGYADNPSYKEKIESIAAGKNVALHLKFLEDDEMATWIDSVDAIILPYNARTSLNSGASILAFSYGTTVIGTKTGTLREFPEELVYSYEYENESEHSQKLIEQIEKAYNDYKADKNQFAQKGMRLKQLIDERGSIDKIGLQYRALYESLLNS